MTNPMKLKPSLWRLYSAWWAGWIAFGIALDLGLPVWRSWPFGDATDFGVLTAAFVFCLLASTAKDAGQ